MPQQLLSDVLIRALPVREMQYDTWDTKLPAFGIRVSPGGTKTFILNQNKVRRSLGRWGVVTLSEARTEARRQMAEKTLGRVRPQSITYEQAVKLFIQDREKRCRSRAVQRSLLNLMEKMDLRPPSAAA